MSRVDDDIEDRRAAERLLQQQAQEEVVAKKKQADGSEFDRRMRETTAQKAFQSQREGERTAHQEHEARRDPRPGDVVREAREAVRDAYARESAQTQQQRQGQDARAGQSQMERKTKEGTERRSDAAALLQDRRTGGDRADQQRVERRKEGHAFGDDLNRGRSEGQSPSQKGKSEGKGEASDAKVERQGNEGQSKGNKGDQSPGQGQGGPPGFHLNPALLAPPPLARPREDGRNERLRQLANEIAQKIVEKARVGKNAAGQAEFQLDLRSNVLSGLSIKVSASGGRISALFTGSDRKVLAMLRENAETLKQSLQSRGLSLVELKIEARA